MFKRLPKNSGANKESFSSSRRHPQIIGNCEDEHEMRMTTEKEAAIQLSGSLLERFHIFHVAQTILSAGSRDIPVPRFCFLELATGKPALRHKCKRSNGIAH